MKFFVAMDITLTREACHQSGFKWTLLGQYFHRSKRVLGLPGFLLLGLGAASTNHPELQLEKLQMPLNWQERGINFVNYFSPPHRDTGNSPTTVT